MVLGLGNPHMNKLGYKYTKCKYGCLCCVSGVSHLIAMMHCD